MSTATSSRKRKVRSKRAETTFTIDDSEDDLSLMDLDESWTEGGGERQKKKTAKKVTKKKAATTATNNVASSSRATAAAASSSTATSSATGSSQFTSEVVRLIIPRLPPPMVQAGSTSHVSTIATFATPRAKKVTKAKTVKPKEKGTTTTEPPKKRTKSAKGAGTSSSSSNCQDQLVSEALECIICLEFAASPINNCANGHITCGVCVKKLPEKKCAMCKAKLTVSVFGERLAKQLELKIKCDFYDQGCKEIIKSTDFKRHVAKCFFRPVKCCETRFEICLEKVIPITGFLDHLYRGHGIVKHNTHTLLFKVRFQKLAGKGGDASKNQLRMMPMETVVTYKGKSFFRMGYRTKDTFYTWFVFLGSKDEADKYGYSLKLVSEKPGFTKFNYSVRLPVFPFHSEFGFKKPSPLFASFPISALMEFAHPAPIVPPTAGSAPPVQAYDCKFQLDMFTV